MLKNPLKLSTVCPPLDAYAKASATACGGKGVERIKPGLTYRPPLPWSVPRQTSTSECLVVSRPVRGQAKEERTLKYRYKPPVCPRTDQHLGY